MPLIIGTFVTFNYGSDFHDAKIRKIAELARPRFKGMTGLRSKAFSLNPQAREAVTLYVWDSAQAAKTLFNDELVQGVTDLY